MAPKGGNATFAKHDRVYTRTRFLDAFSGWSNLARRNTRTRVDTNVIASYGVMHESTTTHGFRSAVFPRSVCYVLHIGEFSIDTHKILKQRLQYVHRDCTRAQNVPQRKQLKERKRKD